MLDLNEAVRLCLDHGLCDGLLYVYNRGLQDYVTPLQELLLQLRRRMKEEGELDGEGREGEGRGEGREGGGGEGREAVVIMGFGGRHCVFLPVSQTTFVQWATNSSCTLGECL